MTKLPAIILALIVCAAIFSSAAVAQPEDIVVQELKTILPNAVSDKVQYKLGNLQYDFANSKAIGTNGVYINYHHGHNAAVLTADNVVFDYKTGDADAD